MNVSQCCGISAGTCPIRTCLLPLIASYDLAPMSFQGFTGGSDSPGILSYTSPSSLRALASGANLFHTSESPMRHIQLFSVLPGRFILPLLSRRMISCHANHHVSIPYVIPAKRQLAVLTFPSFARLSPRRLLCKTWKGTPQPLHCRAQCTLPVTAPLLLSSLRSGGCGHRSSK